MNNELLVHCTYTMHYVCREIFSNHCIIFYEKFQMFKFQPSCLFFLAKRHCPMLGGFSTNMLKPYTGCQCFPKDACNPLVVVYCCPFKFFLLVVFSIPHDVIIYLFLIVRYLKISKLLYLIQYGFCSMWCSINVYIVVMQSLATMPHLIFILIVYRHECIVKNSTMLNFSCFLIVKMDCCLIHLPYLSLYL